MFELQLDRETFPEAMPGFWFVRIVELVSTEAQFSLRNEPCVEPEVEWTFLIVFRDVSGAGLEEYLDVSPEDWTVDSLDGQQVRTFVVTRLTVYLRKEKVLEDLRKIQIRDNF